MCQDQYTIAVSLQSEITKNAMSSEWEVVCSTNKVHVTDRKRNASRTARSAFGTTCLTGVFFIIHRRSADCNQPDAEGEPEEVLQGERNHLFWVVGTRAPQRSWRHLRVGLWSKMILVELMIC